MSLSERQRYTSKPLDTSDKKTPIKYNSFGVSFDELERRETEEKKAHHIMQMTIQDILQSAVENNGLSSIKLKMKAQYLRNILFTALNNLTFIFFSTSYFIQTSDYRIFPAEIALAKFSLAKGVHGTLHMLVNPGPLPLGYAADAALRSRKLHRLPLPPNIEGETNYDEILSKILNFIGCDKEEIPPLFVEDGLIEDDYYAALLTWNMIKKETNNDEMKVRVYPTHSLLHQLYKKIESGREPDAKKFFPLGLAKEKLTRDYHQYAEIGCPFHIEHHQSHICCLSKVQRWGYMFADTCLSKNELIPGQHLPLYPQSCADNQTELENESYWDSNQDSSFVRSDELNSTKTNEKRSKFVSSFPSTLTLDTSKNQQDSHRESSDSIDLVRQEFPTGSTEHLPSSSTDTNLDTISNRRLDSLASVTTFNELRSSRKQRVLMQSFESNSSQQLNSSTSTINSDQQLNSSTSTINSDSQDETLNISSSYLRLASFRSFNNLIHLRNIARQSKVGHEATLLDRNK